MSRKQSPRGRRPGQPETREQILDAGRRLFAERGFEGASVRSIADEAGVDASLINHYFGSKEGLFQAVMELPLLPAEKVAQILESSAPEEVPARLVDVFLDVWEGPESGPAMVALLRRGLGDPGHLRPMQSYMGAALGPVMARITGAPHEEALLRFSLIASHLLGAMTTRHVLRLEPFVGLSREQLEAFLIPVVAHYLRGDLPEELREGKRP